MATGAQSDAAQPLLYNIYKLGKWEYKPDNREPYEVRRCVRLSDSPVSHGLPLISPTCWCAEVSQRPHAARPHRETTPGSVVANSVLANTLLSVPWSVDG
jgi:hypothetical protein